MASKKQIIYPFIAITLGVGSLIGLSMMKKPPEEKVKEAVVPVVNVSEVSVSAMQLAVSSYGIVKAKYETQLVAQVSGEIVELSPDFVRGGVIKQGQLLARIDPSDYEAALIEAEATLAGATAALELEKAAGHVAEEEWKRIDTSKPTELSLRKPQLAQELARVKAAEAGLKRAKRDLERTQIRAPYDALIDAREIGLGSFVSMGSNIGQLLFIDVAEVRLPIADNELKYLANQGIGSDVELVAEHAGEKHSWMAKIVRSEGVIDNRSRMNYLVAEITDPYAIFKEGTQLRFGDYVTARVQGISVPSASVIANHLVVENRVAVYEDEKLVFKDVQVLRHDGAEVVISEGLSHGDKIITSSLDYPVSGMTLALPTSIDDSEGEEEVDAQLALNEG